MHAKIFFVIFIFLWKYLKPKLYKILRGEIYFLTFYFCKEQNTSFVIIQCQDMKNDFFLEDLTMQLIKRIFMIYYITILGHHAKRAWTKERSQNRSPKRKDGLRPISKVEPTRARRAPRMQTKLSWLGPKCKPNS